MALEDDDSDRCVAVVALPIDRETVAWLNMLAEVTGATPESIIASMLRDIRIDDERMHSLH